MGDELNTGPADPHVHRPMTAPNIDGSLKIPRGAVDVPAPDLEAEPAGKPPLKPEDFPDKRDISTPAERDPSIAPVIPILRDKQDANPVPAQPQLRDKRSQLEDVHNQVAELEPETAARVLATSTALDASPASVAADLPAAEKAARAPSGSFLQELEAGYPGTTKWLTKPENMAVAKDDLPNLAKHEHLVQGVTQANSFLEAIKAGYQQSVTGLITRGKLPDTAIPPGASITQSLASQIGTLAGDFPAMILGGEVGRAGGALAGGVAGNIAEPGFGGLIGSAAGGTLGAGAGAFAFPAAIREALSSYYKEGGVKSAGDFWKRAYEIFKQSGKQAIVGAATSGVGAGTASLVEDAIANLGVKGVTAKIAQEVAPLSAEVLTMTSLGKFMEGQVPEARDFAEGLLLVGAMHAAGKSGQYISGLLQGPKADIARNFYVALGDTAEASKVRSRLPPAYREAVDSITKGSPVENVLIPHEAFDQYFQSKGLPPELVAEQLGVRDSLLEARKTGENVSIPLATMIDKFTGTEHFQGLSGDVKFDPEDFTANQVAARKEEWAKQIQAEEQTRQEEAQKAMTPEGQTAQLEGQTPAAEPEPEPSRIYDEHYLQLREAGRSKAEAQAAALIHQKFFEVLAAKRAAETGEKVDPYQIYKEGFPLEVNRANAPQGAAGGQTYEQSNLPAVAGSQAVTTPEGREQSPLGFYSQLHEEVAKMDFKSMPAKDLAARIKNLPGIKQEELEFMGLPDFLKAKTEAGEKVSKEEALAFIKQNGLKVDQKVLSADFGPSREASNAATAADLSWDDGEIQEPDSDYVHDEASYYTESLSNMRDHFPDDIEEIENEVREELTPEYTDSDGKVDKAALEKAVKKKALSRGKDELSDKAYDRAYEYLTSPDNDMANWIYRERKTGWTLHGSHESGWWSPELQETFEGDSLEEVKVKLVEHMLARGEIEGKLSDILKPQDIEWNSPVASVLKAENKSPRDTPRFKADVAALLKSDLPRLKALAEESVAWKKESPEVWSEQDIKDSIASKIQSQAEDEVIEKHSDQTNPENRVKVSFKVGPLKGYLVGNDANGYTLKIPGGQNRGDVSEKMGDVPLEQAKAKAIEAMQKQDLIASPKPEAEAEEPKEDVNTPTGKSKWNQYKLPGGTNYREILLRLPDISPEFRGGHFGESNVLAHIRVTDRVDAEGRKTLFIEEMQSDWHQKGREEGYAEKLSLAEKDEHEQLSNKEKLTPEEDARLSELNRKADASVPNAPYKNTDAWTGLALKRMIRMAVEQGYDALAWSPSEVQVDRWGTEEVGWQKYGKGRLLKKGDEVIKSADVDGWLVGSTEQRGGRAGGVDIEAEARRRGKLLEKSGEVVTTKEELAKVMAETLGRERTDRSLESLVDSTWERMQKEDSGVRRPREEGMKFFYDNLLPKKVAPVVLKKLDPKAKVEVGKLTDVAQRGAEGEEGEPKAQKMWEIPLTDTLKKKAMGGQTLFQKPGDEGPRGRIRLGDESAHVDLFRSANKSTFLHESGHYFLDVMGKVAAEDGAPASIKQDHATVLKWLGAESTDKITSEQHEKFARGFEAYLMEGKSPSSALKRVFDRFRNWLTSIYKNVKNLNVELTPEIRAVMDRMLATNEEIKRAQDAVGYKAEIPDGIPESVAKGIDELATQARDQAENTLLREQMKEISTKNQEFLKGEREKARVQAEKEVAELPLYRAMTELTKGNKKDAVAMAHGFLDDQVTDAQAADFETKAEGYGFDSGLDLARKIVESDANDGRAQEIKMRVDRAMAPHAPMMDTDAIRLEAMKAIHGEKMTELLALEHEALLGLVNKATISQEASRRNRIEASIAAEEAKTQAKEILGKKTVKEAGNPGPYVTAERNAAVKVSKALAAKDYELAAKAKSQQMLNHALAAEAMRNRDEIDSAVRYMRDQGNRSSEQLRRVPYAFNRQVDTLLGRFELGEKPQEDAKGLQAVAQLMSEQKQTPQDIANTTGFVRGDNGAWKQETLPDFIQRINADNYALELPPSVFQGVDRPYQELKLEQLRDLKDAVKALVTVGNAYNRYLVAFDKAEINATAKQMRADVEENIGKPHEGAFLIGFQYDSKLSELRGKVKNILDLAIPSKVNMLTLCDYLDLKYRNGKYENDPQGLFKETMYRPIKHAEDSERVRLEKAAKDIEAIRAEFYTPEEVNAMKSERKTIAEFGRSMSKEQLLALALNWGNETNRDRIRRGYGLEDSQVMSVLDRELEKRDWDFAQKVWDHLDSFRPELAALEMKMRGSEPTWVEPSEVKTKDGTYKGGYYPIAYDYTKSADAARFEAQKSLDFAQHSTAYAMTDRGHAMERVAVVSRPVNLSLDVLFNHIKDLIHDLEYRPAVVDVSRTLNHRDVKAAIQNAIGLDGFRSMDNWLKEAASRQSDPMRSEIDHVFDWLRYKTSLSMLTYRAIIFPLKASVDLTNAVDEVGINKFASAIGKGLLSPVESTQFASEKSVRMAKLAVLSERDLIDLQKKYAGTAESGMRKYQYLAEFLANKLVAIPIWNEVYRNSVGEFGDKKAIDLADEACTRAFGSGSPIDLVGAQRGGSGKKLLSMFYTFDSMMFNRAWKAGKIAGLEYSKENTGRALAIMAGTFATAWILPALSANVLREFSRNTGSNDPDEDERMKRIGIRFATQPFNYFPIARGIGHALAYTATGSRGGEFKLSPLEDSVQAVIKGIGEPAHSFFSDKEFDQRTAEDAARGAAVLLGTPQTLNNFIFNYLDSINEDGPMTWRDAIGRRVKK